MKPWICAAFVLSSVAAPALGQELGDAVAGYDYATEICSECHAVGGGEAVSPVFDAPPFQMIANDPEISDLALVVFFQSPHPSMPNLIVPANDARDLIAYIRSLNP